MSWEVHILGKLSKTIWQLLCVERGGGYLPILAQNIVRKRVEGGTRPTVEMKKTSISISSHIRICPGYSVFLP